MKPDNKESLKNNLKKRVRTTMIGAIAAIEDEFGFLFGHGKIELTQEEKALDHIFQEIRGRILDLGNEQIEKIESDVEPYNIEGPYYKYDFKIIKKGN